MLRPLPLAVLGLILALPTSGRPQGAQSAEAAKAAYSKVAKSVDQDLNAALAELAKQRDAIAAEKPALSKESNTIAAELREKRRLSELARTSREAAETEFTQAEGKLKAWRDEKLFVEGLLFEFRKVAEAEQSLARNESNRALLDDPTSAGHLALLEATVQQLQDLGKVAVIEGDVLTEGGVFVKGTFAEAGPVSWFLSDDGNISGLTAGGSDLRPRIVPETAQTARITTAIKGERTDLLFDPTMGTAVALKETKRTFVEHVRDGGFWMYPILLLGVIAFITGVIKWLQLSSRIRHFSPKLVQEVINHLNRGEDARAKETAAKIRHPARKLLEHGIETVTSDKPFTKVELEESLYEKYIEAVPPLQRGLPLLSVAAGAGPLLGLLATVTGIMQTFRLITIFGSGDAKPLASGISEALIGTEYGLIVAIPSLISYALLSRKVHGAKDAMELTSLAFVNGINPESFSEPTPMQRTFVPTEPSKEAKSTLSGNRAEGLA